MQFLDPTPPVTERDADPMMAQLKLARDRALQVIGQFQQQEQADLPLSVVALKRKAALAQLEQRKQLALVKNLEYLAKVEDDRLRTTLLKAQQAQSYQIQVEAFHEQSLQTRQLHLRSSFGDSSSSMDNLESIHAGIGTQQRHRAEERRRKHDRTASMDTVAVYVSNLPRDGSVNDELVRALFGSLGYDLRKIHFYVNKGTNELKGDALVVYELPPDQDRQTLTETVCEQMNGAELPCGTPITVEPSDPLYKLRKKREASNHYGSTPTKDPQETPVTDNAEDLDGFFESLDGAAEDDGGDSENRKYLVGVQIASEDHESHGTGKGEEDGDLEDFFHSLS